MRLPREVREAGLRWEDAEVAAEGWSDGWFVMPNGIRVTWELPELPAEITAAQLEDMHACVRQVELFRATFGEAAEVTAANLRLARRVGLDVGWLAKRVGLRMRHLRAAA